MYNPKLFIGVNNSQDFVPSQFFWTWERMEKPYKYIISRQEFSFPSQRNNMMVKEFLASDCDVMVKMDIDQKYPHDYFVKMVPLVEKYKVIGPLLYNKWRRLNFRVLMNLTKQGPFTQSEQMKEWSGIEEVPYPHSNLFYVRESLENITPPWYENKFSSDGKMRLEGGDHAFVEKIREQGFKLYINTDVLVQHLVMAHVDTRLHKIWEAGLRAGL